MCIESVEMPHANSMYARPFSRNDVAPAFLAVVHLGRGVDNCVDHHRSHPFLRDFGKSTGALGSTRAHCDTAPGLHITLGSSHLSASAAGSAGRRAPDVRPESISHARSLQCKSGNAATSVLTLLVLSLQHLAGASLCHFDIAVGHTSVISAESN